MSTFKIIATVYISVVIFSAFLLPVIEGNSCSADCDTNYPNGNSVTFCGVDSITSRLTYKTSYDAFTEHSCYTVCGISTRYAGSCGCPNNCYENLKQGKCQTEDTLTCSCEVGWGGPDCSQPISGNTCSNHGKLVPKDSINFPFDFCACEPGYTGVDCSTPMTKIGNAPWGTIVPGVEPYTDKDQYKDDHPLFNIERLSTFRIELPEEDYVNAILPANVYNDTYTSATCYFDNGEDRFVIPNVGIKVKGYSTRTKQKKGYYIKFNEFVSGQKLYDVKKVGLKAGDVSDDTFIKQVLYANVIRSMGIPVQRMSYALLYINSIFAGLYVMHEDIATPDFIVKRLGDDDGNGFLMKLAWNVHLGYFGPDLSYYKEKAHTNDIGVPLYYYNPENESDEEYKDFVQWLLYLNQTSGSAFEASIESMVDVSRLMNLLPVESYLLGDDNLASGNNFYVYHRQNESIPDQRLLFYQDFDSVFFFEESEPHKPTSDPNIFGFFNTTQSDDFDEINPLLDNIFAIKKYRDLYIQNYNLLLNGVFGPQSAQQVTDRYRAVWEFLLPWVTRDNMWQMVYDMTPQNFSQCVLRSISNFPLRYASVKEQLSEYAQGK